MAELTIEQESFSVKADKRFFPAFTAWRVTAFSRGVQVNFELAAGGEKEHEWGA
ncbi:hypothetical protein HMPREF3038_02406 [Akkermansia sp. KLE1797]|nr:hypothetical protein HMPREF3038_02406 [Akkermansia sp. KLE1797]KXU54860.1 hypothetical protein HMPREF3039_01009 [Akkermansia sp. KLE1798]KZA06244.1 hypothetical protein HMPREF1326_00094 [Akkermansia sp. KLE1605]